MDNINNTIINVSINSINKSLEVRYIWKINNPPVKKKRYLELSKYFKFKNSLIFSAKKRSIKPDIKQ